MTMFSSLKLPSLRSRAKGGSGSGNVGNSGGGNGGSVCNLSSPSNQPPVTGKPPRTPLPSRHRWPSKCGVDRGLCPSIGALRPGSAAQRSDTVCTGDRLTSVNGIRTSQLRHEELSALLRNVQDRALLELEYPLPEPAEQCAGLATRVRQVRLEREGGSLGFTLRGGSNPDPGLTRPLVVTHVRPGGPADKEGTLQVGDRVVAAGGVSLVGASLAEAQAVLQRAGAGSGAGTEALLTVEYDVSVLAAAVRQAAGPLLVEVALPVGRDLGLTLTQEGARILVDTVRSASVAERCGALHTGDQILAVGNVRVDCTQGITVPQVQQLLQKAQGSTLALEVLPACHSNSWRLSDGRGRSFYNTKSSPVQPPSPCSSPSGFSTLNLQRRGHYSRSKGEQVHEGTPVSGSSFVGVCHTESLFVILEADDHGYGLSVRDSCTDDHASVVVSHIESGSPAERCGTIQIGDRILVVGTRSIAFENLTASDVMHVLQESNRQRARISLQLEFDVADSVVPSSGIFSVKLAKRGCGLGITITASKSRVAGEPLLISDIRRGSVAHRTGSLQPGDRLLAINGILLDQCSLEDTQHILQNSSDIVTLRVQKDDSFSEHPHNHTVVYTVELARHGGPLGITIAGSEQPFEPITISGLTSGGLAEKTGALHIGDRLLAINGESLQGKPLSDAIALLQNSGDIVTLKIARSSEGKDNNTDPKQSQEEQSHELSAGQFGPALPSVDSAVESWDSCTMGHTSPSNQVSVMELYQAESATVKRRHKGDVALCNWDGLSRSSHSIDSGQSGVLSEDENKVQWGKEIDIDLDSAETEARKLATSTPSDEAESQRYSGNPDHISCSPSTSPLPLPHFLHCNNDRSRYNENSTVTGNKFLTGSGNNTGSECYEGDGCHSFLHLNSLTSPIPSNMELYQVTLFKDSVYEDFGFSVSDGLYERGVFINRIRKGGPADLSSMLKPFDRILQVNDTRTHDFDCCLTVPLIASAGEKLELTVARNPYSILDNKEGTSSLPWVDEEESMTYSHMGYPTSGIITQTI